MYGAADAVDAANMPTHAATAKIDRVRFMFPVSPSVRKNFSPEKFSPPRGDYDRPLDVAVTGNK